MMGDHRLGPDEGRTKTSTHQEKGIGVESGHWGRSGYHPIPSHRRKTVGSHFGRIGYRSRLAFLLSPLGC